MREAETQKTKHQQQQKYAPQDTKINIEHFFSSFFVWSTRIGNANGNKWTNIQFTYTTYIFVLFISFWYLFNYAADDMNEKSSRSWRHRFVRLRTRLLNARAIWRLPLFSMALPSHHIQSHELLHNTHNYSLHRRAISKRKPSIRTSLIKCFVLRSQFEYTNFLARTEWKQKSLWAR